jgi:small subunit ribosomal protein S1
MSNRSSVQSESFATLFEQNSKTSTWINKVVKGSIIGVDDSFIVIDVGLKSEGRIAASEFTNGGRRMELKVGDKIDVYIDHYENRNGEIVLSREKALKEASWYDLEKAYREGTSVMGVICNRVKGGFMVDLNGVNAFLPGSQIDVRPVKDISPLQGIEQPFIILKMDKLRENIVVSRRGILEGANAEERAKVIANLEEGQILDGIVRNVTSYGAFVDIGGIDGLLHNTDISWKRINNAADVLFQGQEIKVKIVKFNRETKRVSLGMKQLVKDPWEGVETEFAVGIRSKGVVTNVTDYGIFVELKDGVEGLVYISEVSWKKNVPPSKVAVVGEEIDVAVLDVDVAKRRIGLGIKQLQDNPWNKVKEDFPVGNIIEGVVSSIAEFGMFVKVTDDIDGMVHISDISWDNCKEEVSKYKKGDVVKVKILEVDPEKERIALSIKQLTVNSNNGAAQIEVKKGAVVTCVITSVNDDGIDVKLTDGSTGFIKKTDLAKDRQDRKSDRFAVGEKIDAKVLLIDKTSRKVSLSIKALEIEEEKQAMAEFGSPDSGASLGDILGVAIKKSKE